MLSVLLLIILYYSSFSSLFLLFPSSLLLLQEPAGPEATAVLEACKDMGVLIGKGGLRGNVIRLKPPMCVTKEDCDFFLEVFERACASL